MKEKSAKPDYILISAAALLVLLGIIILPSVSAAISQEKFGYPTFYLSHHILFGLLPGCLLGLAAFKVSLSFLRKWSPVLLLGNLFLMILVFLPVVGMKLGGSHSWLNLGFVSLQPSEFLKLTFIIYLASWLAARTEKVKKDFSATLWPFLAVIGVVALLLVLQPDVGTLAIIAITVAAMYFLAGTPLYHSLIIIVGGLGGLVALIKMAPYRMDRFLAFIRPEVDPMGASYHIKQALIAVGAGGIYGRGLGTSAQTFVILPQRIADSIFALFAEEAGLIGSLILLSLFLIFAWRGFGIARNAPDKFQRLTASGIVVWIVVQAFVNIGAMLKVLPLTGVPLPFMSYGGSALVTELAALGVLLNIAKHSKS